MTQETYTFIFISLCWAQTGTEQPLCITSKPATMNHGDLLFAFLSTSAHFHGQAPGHVLVPCGHDLLTQKLF